jgi:AAA15 family ATPase/GTPase
MSLLVEGSAEERLAILSILKHADLGISEARITDVNVPDQVKGFDKMPDEIQQQILKHFSKNPELLHQGSQGSAHPLPWETESAGTQRFYSLIGPWLDVLKKGYTVCIDELETSMHPIMVRELLKLFFNEATNPNNAQLIFTTHNPLLLDTTLIRRDQIWLTDKDSVGEAHLYPLTDYKPRGQESLMRGYMAGRYGAVPFIPDGLLGTSASVEV